MRLNPGRKSLTDLLSAKVCRRKRRAFLPSSVASFARLSFVQASLIYGWDNGYSSQSVNYHRISRNIEMPRRQNATIVTLTPGKRNGQTGEAIHLNIYNAIIGHRIPPGTALQEDALASAFDVSRTTIRKVLQRLSHERLVDLVPNKGASVAKPSVEEACEVFEARRAIERILVDRLVATGSDEGIATLVRTAQSEKAADERGNKPERVKLSGDFHRQLAKIAGNTILCGFLNELISRTSLIIALYESPGAVPCSHGEHLEIANALMRRDARKAVQYMEHHLQHVEAQIELSDSYQRIDFGKLFRGRT